MTDQQLYCDVSECEDPEHPGFPRRAFRSGKCSSHMKQLQRTGRTTNIAPKLSLEERLFAEAERMVEIDTSIHADRDEAIARRNVVAIAKQLGRQKVSEAIREAHRRRRARGEPVGRRPKVDMDRLRRLLDAGLRPKQIAVSLDVCERTVWRALTKIRVLSERERRNGRPQARRGS